MSIINTVNGGQQINGNPDECPFCHNKITPVNVFGFRNQNRFDAMQVCPNTECSKAFIAYYYFSGNSINYDSHTTQGFLIGKEFSNSINEISSSFVTIYNQAFSAEQQNLTEICGVGYRKALEFLIKDYIIKNNPDNSEKVEKKMLGACIAEYIDDKRIETVAKRAVWLGNDETHYIRKWEGKNLEDLKKLIELTVHWIEMEFLTMSFENEMPE